LQGNDDSSASEAEVSDNALRAESTAATPGVGSFDGPETAIDSITPAPRCSSNGWHNIETGLPLPLAERETSMSNPIHSYTPLSRLLSEPLHDSVSMEGSCHARSEATTSSLSPPPRQCKSSSETQRGQEGCLYIGRGVAGEHVLVDYVFDTLLVGEDKGT
jgi:hypothetical protein